MKESYEWILRAIETSNNEFHLRCCKTLIGLFLTQYPKALDEYGELIGAYTSKEAMIMV